MATHVLDTNALYCLHNTIFQPHLNHCIEIYGNTYKNNSNPEFILQKTLYELSVMLVQMFHRLDILMIYDIIDFNRCIFMYNVFHKLVPLAFQNKFSISSFKKI